MPRSRWSAFRKTCISWRSLRSSAPSGSSSSSTCGRLTIDAGERDPLPLAARELHRLAVAEALEAHHLQHVGDLRRALAAVHALHLQPVADVLGDRHVREERVVLEDRVDVARVRRLVGDVGAAERDSPGVRSLEAGDHPQRRRLARARRPEQREELAVARPSGRRRGPRRRRRTSFGCPRTLTSAAARTPSRMSRPRSSSSSPIGERDENADHVAVDAAREQHQPLLARLRGDACRLLAVLLGQLERHHRAEAAYLRARRRHRVSRSCRRAPIASARARRALDRIEDRERRRTRERVAAERAAEAAGRDCVHHLGASGDGRERQAAAERLAGRR